MATTQQDPFVPLKICNKGEIHRLFVNLGEFHFDELTKLFETTFDLASGSFVVQYTDAEGDVVNVTSEAEFKAAVQAFATSDGSYKTVRFVTAPRAQAVFQEHVADPILKAIEKLVETLNAAMEKVKHEQWAQRAQSGVQTGVVYTNEALKTAAEEARKSLNQARQSIQEIPFDQMLKDTTEGIKAAADGISVFAKEVIEEMKKEQMVRDAAEGISSAAVGITVFAKERVEDLKKEQVVMDAAEGIKSAAASISELAKDAVNEFKKRSASEQDVVVAGEVVEVAQAAPASADSEWEQVAEQTTSSIEEEIVEVVVSEEEKKWADQLSTIRDILPDVDTTRAIQRLEEANGNVELVLNALMEEM
jgi:histone H3/H4|uniref:PB1 domain-containing protein n=1 Tax=Globisporangium ultimum (strain ATCC 200006 / CBS 805.95 / DAOM BR144) TaxID=431595 RepID=K3X234_GLOUD